MEDFFAFKRRFVLLIVGVALIILSVLILLGYHQVGQGLGLGTAAAIFAFWIHGNVLKRASSMYPKRAKFYVFFNFLLRYILYFLILLTTLQLSVEHFWGAAGGLVVPRLVILVFYTFKAADLAAMFKSNPTETNNH